MWMHKDLLLLYSGLPDQTGWVCSTMQEMIPEADVFYWRSFHLSGEAVTSFLSCNKSSKEEEEE